MMPTGWCPGTRTVTGMLATYPGTSCVRIFFGPGDGLPASAWTDQRQRLAQAPAAADVIVSHKDPDVDAAAFVAAWQATGRTGRLILVPHHEPEQQTGGDPTPEAFRRSWTAPAPRWATTRPGTTAGCGSRSAGPCNGYAGSTPADAGPTTGAPGGPNTRPTRSTWSSPTGTRTTRRPATRSARPATRTPRRPSRSWSGWPGSPAGTTARADDGWTRRPYAGTDPGSGRLHLGIRATDAAERDQRAWGLVDNAGATDAARLLALLKDPTVATQLRALPWQYVGGGIPKGRSTLAVLDEILQTVRVIGEAVARQAADPTPVRAALARLPEPRTDGDPGSGTPADSSPAPAVPGDVEVLADALAARVLAALPADAAGLSRADLATALRAALADLAR
ncbi:hypothetical protein [Micromonospora narathiwatensis]|uniref:Uncharacterized protein n=1 Tax=Micromonospora narathiwatensis TaxID=299146 RepID=A0A1A8ZK30_9ACTN|nr:hypothetical protein [Micromonospora narathiwatensis]SBT44207.1 hypothetical protein GA0070621_2003 [Micromonospora narathiwatensis]